MRSQHGRKDHRSEDDRGTAAIISSESADQFSNFVLLVSGWLGRQRSGKTRGRRVLPGSLRSGEEEETISAAQTRDGCRGATVALILLSPVFLVLAVLVKVTSKGPV